MGRRTIIVDQEKLQDAIIQAEKDGPLDNLNKLWIAACEIYNGMEVPEPITFSVVMLRATQWQLTLATKAGRKGRANWTDEEKKAQVEKMQAGRSATRVSKAVKIENSGDAQTHIALLLKSVPDALRNLVAAVAKGRRKAAEKLFCLQCMGYDCGAKQAIGVCGGGHSPSPCPLWLNRPYQKASEIDAEADGVFVVEDEDVAA